MDFKELIFEAIDDEFIISLVEDFGGSLIRDGNDKIIFTTICHGGHSPKLYYYKDSKTFYCYSECGTMSIYDFIMACKECDFTEAASLLRRELQIEIHGDLLSCSNVKNFSQLLYEKQNKEALLKEQEQQHLKKMNSRLPAINDTILNYFNYTEYLPWEDEGFEAWALEKFNIGYHYLSKSIIIPHYNEYNELVGIRRRTFDDCLLQFGKYTPLILNNHTYAHSLGTNFYGLNQAKKAIQANKKVIIVESEKAVIKSYQWFKDASLTIAPCGFNLTAWQLYRLIVKYKVKEIILCLDCDYIGKPKEAYNIWIKKVTKMAERIKKLDASVKVTLMSDDGTYLNPKENCFDKQNNLVFQKLFINRKELLNGKNNM